MENQKFEELKKLIEDFETEALKSQKSEPKKPEINIVYPSMNELRQPEEKVIEKIVTYEKLSGKLWRKLAVFSLLLSLVSGIAGGYIADNFNKERLIIRQENTVENQTLKEVSIQNSVDSSRRSVVEIKTTVEQSDFFGRTYQASGAGSGVIISEDGYVITNAHVIKDSDSIEITDYLGNKYNAEIIGKDEKSDIGVLRIKADKKFDSATIGNSEEISVGESIFVIGNPLGTLGGSVTGGIISALERDVFLDDKYQTLIQTDATINSGNSGGGLFDYSGRLIGIINAKDSGFTSNGTIIEGIGFAIPINKAMDIAQQLMISGKVTDRAYLGVKIIEALDANDSNKTNFYIGEIAEDSVAEKAGLKIGDKIVSVNNEEITTFPQLYKIIDNAKVGDVMNFTIERNGENYQFQVEF